MYDYVCVLEKYYYRTEATILATKANARVRL